MMTQMSQIELKMSPVHHPTLELLGTAVGEV